MEPSLCAVLWDPEPNVDMIKMRWLRSLTMAILTPTIKDDDCCSVGHGGHRLLDCSSDQFRVLDCSWSTSTTATELWYLQKTANRVGGEHFLVVQSATLSTDARWCCELLVTFHVRLLTNNSDPARWWVLPCPSPCRHQEWSQGQLQHFPLDFLHRLGPTHVQHLDC